MKKYTQEKYVEEVKNIYGDKYDYSNTIFTSLKDMIEVYCNKCGSFFRVSASKHLYNHHGCKLCSKEKMSFDRKSNTTEFVEKAKKIHGDKYDYSQVNYINCDTKVKIRCNRCGKYFMQTPNSHLRGSGCNNCNRKEALDKIKLKKAKEFVEKAKEKHGDLYDYSLVDYQDAKKVVKIICNRCHKVFYQTPNNHLRGQGCSYCNGNHKKDLNYFIEKAKAIHGDRYDYSEVEYKNNRTPVKIKCNKCGKYFYQDLGNHISQKQGCPYCYASGGENIIVNFLDKYKIIYESQKKFKDCKDKTYLRFDFYLPDYTMCIEYQGKQHYEEGFNFYMDFLKDSIKARKSFEDVKRRDQIKRDYCSSHNIDLVEIRYDEDIKQKLSEILCVEI